MHYEIRSQDGVTVLLIQEPQLTHDVSAELKAELLILTAQDEKEFVIDLSKVTDCDSDGVAALLIAQRSLAHSGRPLKLVGVSKDVRTVFRLSQLESSFEFYPSLRAALATGGTAGRKG